MSPRGPRREDVRSGRAGDSGSLLAEAIVGIGLIGLVTASVATLLPAVLDAQVRARSHHAALMVADLLLESDAAGMPSEGARAVESLVPPHVEPSIERIEAGPAEEVVVCDGRLGAATRSTTVDVKHGGRTAGRDVTFRAGARIAPATTEASDVLVLRVEGNGLVPADDLVLVDPDGHERTPEILGPDCVGHLDLPRGMWWVTAADGPALPIDRAHVPLAQRPLPISIDGRSHDRTVAVASAGWLRVIVDDGGARLPDLVEDVSDGLQWLVRGDDANTGTDLGDVRPVHPGPVTAVIPACADAGATGSSGSVTVPVGEEVTLQIALPVVTVEGIGDRSDVRLRLRRTTPCADGAAFRAALIFEGALHDGMRVAVPRGEWDASLVTLDDRPLTGSRRFVAAGTDVGVRIP